MLSCGSYYIKTYSDNAPIIGFYHGSIFERTLRCDIKEILAPVPTFEEWRYINEELERLESNLNNSAKIEFLLKNKIEDMQTQLKIAREALYCIEKEYFKPKKDIHFIAYDMRSCAYNALKQLDELKGGK